MKQTSGYPRREDKRGYSSDICVHDLGGWTGQEWTLNQLWGKAAFTALRHLSSVHILLFCILLCWCYLWICDPWLPFLTDWTLVAFPSSVLAALYLFALHLFFTKASYAKLPGLHFYEVWTTTKKKHTWNAIFANRIQTTFGDGLKCDIKSDFYRWRLGQGALDAHIKLQSIFFCHSQCDAWPCQMKPFA